MTFPNLHISYAGPTRTIIDANGKRSPFWRAVTRWAQGGHRLNGIECIWEEEPRPILEHIGGKHYRVVGWV